MDAFELIIFRGALATAGLVATFFVARFGYKLIFGSDNKKELEFFHFLNDWIRRPINISLVVLAWGAAVASVLIG